MSSRYVSTVAIIGLGPLASTTVPHNCRVPDSLNTPFIPNIVWPDRATPIVVTAVTETTVTFFNPTAALQTATFWVEITFTTQRAAHDTTNVYWQGVLAGGGGAGVAIAAGTQTATSGTVIFSNLNGLSFGMAGNATVTASMDAIRQISAGVGAASGSGVSFADANNVTFGIIGQTVTASASMAGMPAIQSISAGTTRITTGEAVFSNSNGVSFGVDGQTVTASVSREPSISAGTQLASSGTVVFSNSNNVSFGMSDSSVVTASASFLQSTQPGIQSISAGTTRITTGEAIFSNSNNVTFGADGQTITASVASSLTAINLSAGTTSNNLSAITFSNGNNVTFGLNGSTLTASVTVASTQGSVNLSAGTTSNLASAFTFSDANGISFGLNASTITASVAAGATATGNLGAISAGTTQATSGTIVFSNSNNVSFGVNGQTVTASVGLPTVRAYTWPDAPVGSFGSSDAALSLAMVQVPYYLTATRLVLIGHMSDSAGASLSTGGISMSVGVYTMSGSTASLASSGSRFLSWTTGIVTTVTNGFGNASGTQYRSIPIGTWNLTPGDYLFAFWGRTTNAGSWSWWGLSQTLSRLNNFDTASGEYYLHGFSTSSFTTAMPASINVTDTNYVRSGASAYRQPGFMLHGDF